MKKLLLSVLAICAFAVTTNAQEIKVGAKAGLNMANVTGDVEDNKMLIGLHIGAMAEIGISDQFAVQPELLFSMQGAKSDADGGEDLKLNYINLPIMAKYFATEGLSIEAGPQVGFLMSADQGEDVKDNFKGIDFGFNFGAGYKMENGLNFALRYNLGLSNILDVDGIDDEMKNGVFQVSIGYFFM